MKDVPHPLGLDAREFNETREEAEGKSVSELLTLYKEYEVRQSNLIEQLHLAKAVNDAAGSERILKRLEFIVKQRCVIAFEIANAMTGVQE